MKNHSASLNFLLLFLFGAAFLWMGCDPDPDATCDDEVPEISFSEYCSPNLLTVGNLDTEEITGADLPNFCTLNYARSRTVKIAVPSSGNIVLHQYVNFPGMTFTEIIGTNCEGSFVLLNNCLDRSDAIVRTFDIDGVGYNTIYVRVVYPGDGGYEAGSRPTDNIAFAAFSGPPSSEQLNDGTSKPVYQSGCGNYTNRIILTPGSGRDPIEVAQELGLPFDACECSDGELVTIYAPVGVDVNAVRPKIKEKDTEIDTVETTLDFIISIPAVKISDELDPRQRPEISEDECQLFQDPVSSGGAEGVVVTIVDSGIDVTAPNVDVFSNNADPLGRVACIPAGPLGSDLIFADETPDDEVGHGTAVASVFLSGLDAATSVTLINNKFFGPNGGTLFDALCGSYAGIQAGSHIMNWSWGFESDEEPAALIALLDRAVERDVAIVNSAGNDGQELGAAFPYWPSVAGDRYDNLLVVASFDGGFLGTDPFLKSWSNRGVPFVEVGAFFTANALQFGPGSTPWPVGTSISAPIVTRELAELKSENFGESAGSLIGLFLKGKTKQNGNFSGQIVDEQYLPVAHSSEGGCE